MRAWQEGLRGKRERLGAALAAVLALLCCAAITLSAHARTAPDSDGYQWRNVTVGAGGFAPNIIFSRAESDLAYLRTDMGGAYRWDQPRQRWIPLQDANSVSSYMGIESIAPDPVDPDILYLAAGMHFRGEAAIWRSADRGATWRITPVPFKMGGNEDGRGLGERLAVHPSRTSTLFFGSRHDGLWRSDDSASSWSKVASFPHAGLGPPQPRQAHAGISFILFDPAGAIYAAVADPAEKHLYRSADGGATWTAVPGGPASTMLPVRADVDGRGNLYIAYATSIGPSGIKDGSLWRLDTRNGNWTDITPDPPSEGGYMGISVDRQRPGRLVVSSINRWQPGDTVWLSEDYGRSWSDLGPRSRRDIAISPWLDFGEKEPEFGHWTAGLAIDPFDGGNIAYTTGATMYRTDEGMRAGRLTWRPWVRGIEQTAVITLISPTGGAQLISGFGDLGGFVHDKLEASPPRIHLGPHLSNTNNLDYAGLAPSIVVRSGSRHDPEPDGASLAWSEDGGRSWQPLKARPIGGQRHDTNGEPPITVNADGKVFVVATPVAVATRDRGRSWFTPSGLPQNVRVVADKADPMLFYAIDFAASRLFVSRDGARSFSPVAAAGLPRDFSTDRPRNREAQPVLQATPGRAGELWAKLGGSLYRSDNAGASFARAASDIAVEQFGLGHPAPSHNVPALYVTGTRSGIRGVWRSDDGGATWLRINDDAHQWGLRFRAISGDPRIYGRVYLATDGRGILYGDPAPRR
jgi:xyloglucan-specific exo-beta-1,4-glucanase